jgi:flagellar biosynthesis component FlhA
MIPFVGGTPHCKRCGYEVERGRETCRACDYNPKSKALRVALSLLVVVVVSMSVVMMVPIYQLLVIRLAAIAFVLTVVVLLLSFLVTPHRLGRLFLWP